MPDTYVGLLGTQPSKNVNKQMEKKKSCGVSTLSPELRFISCENQSAMKTAFFPQYNHFNLLADGALEKQKHKKVDFTRVKEHILSYQI